jgi:hypothetical protein
VISGQRGYCLTRQSSIQDIDAFVNRMHSQAREMRMRAVRVGRVRHNASSRTQ